MRREPAWLTVLTATGLGLWLVVAIFPFLWMILISFRSPVDAFSVPPELFAPFTLENFRRIWLVDGFWHYGISTLVVTFFTVLISLGIGCLAGYALSRYGGMLGFWLLLGALVFRAMPHVVLLTAYKPAFFELGLWSRYETLIIVYVAINQPFTIWMLRSFFVNIPRELDEAALGNYLGQSRHMDKLMLGIAGAVSITLPLIVLVLLFQKYLVSGLTQGAVKG